MIESERSAVVRFGTRLRDKSDWQRLLEGQVDAIHLKAFANLDECAQLTKFIARHPRRVQYSTVAGVTRLGSSFSDVRKVGNSSEEYSRPDILEEALEVNTVISRVLGTIVGSWPYGLETFSYQGFPLHRAVARTIAGGSGEPHDDHLAKEVPEDPVGSTVQTQLGVNLYLGVPDEGGELEGWHRRLTQEEYDAFRNLEEKLAYGIRREAIGDAHWEIKPGLGDLILFMNSEVHAIRASQGARTTWGFFLGYRGDSKPLIIWS